MVTVYEWIQRGELNLAFAAVQSTLEKDSENKTAKKEMFHVLSLLLKREIDHRHPSAVLRVLEKIANLSYQPEKYESDCFFWYCRAGLSFLKNELATKAGYIIGSYLKSRSTINPSDAYSAMLSAAVRNPDVNILTFVQTWNLKNLREKDYKPVKTEKRAYPSIVSTLMKPLKVALEKDDHDEYPDLKQHLSDIIFKVINDTINYPFAPYYYVQLNRNNSDPDMLLEKYRQFLAEHHKDFWAWKAAGDLYGENHETSISCYCQALLCKSKPEFLIGVRNQLIPILIKKQMYCEARFELDTIIEVRKQNEWGVEEKHLDYLCTAWYKESQILSDNQKMYHQYAPLALKLLGCSTELIAIVTEIKDKYFFWAAEGGIGGRQKKSALNNEQIIPGEILQVTIQGNPEKGIQPFVISVKKTDETITGKWIHHFSGITEEAENSYKIGNVYISRQVGARFGIQTGVLVRGLRVKVWHRKLNKEIWHIISLTYAG
jgi:hypothetical protein